MNYRIFSYSLPYHPPFAERHGLLVCINEMQWGEIAPLPGRNRETLAQAYDQLLLAMHCLSHNLSLPSLLPSVAFGIHSALQPACRPRTIPLSALLTGSPREILQQAEEASRRGFTSAKVKVSHLPHHEIRPLLQELSAHFSLRIDANRAFSYAQACALFDVPCEYIEEPTYEIDSLAHFPHPLALDESALELNDFPPMKAIVIKPSTIGGYQECLELVQRAGAKVVLSSACESGVGIVSIAQLPWIIEPLGLDTYRYLHHDLLRTPLDFSSNTLTLPLILDVNTSLLKELDQ